MGPRSCLFLISMASVNECRSLEINNHVSALFFGGGWNTVPPCQAESLHKFCSMCTYVSRPDWASFSGQSGWAFVEVSLASGSSNLARTIASAIEALLYLASIWALVSQSRAPCDEVVDLSMNFLYRVLFFHSPAQEIHSSSRRFSFSVPQWRHWNPLCTHDHNWFTGISLGCIFVIYAFIPGWIQEINTMAFICLKLHRSGIISYKFKKYK